jgi:hypothetical protein
VTTPASSIKAVKAFFFAGLTSAVTADVSSTSLTLGVFYDHPGTSAPSDMVVVSGATRTVEVSALVGNLGAFAFEDTYLLDVDVQAFRNTPQAAFERAVDMAEQVIAWQRANPTMGGSLITCRPVQVDQPAAEPVDSHKGYSALHTVKFFCRSVY